MNLILHQFKTDWLHFRLRLLVLWCLFASQLILAGSFLDANDVSGFQVLLLFLQIVMGAALLANLVHADALVGSSVQWLTRPVRRPHLFWAKSAFIVICILLPKLAPQVIVCFWHHYPFGLFLCNFTEGVLFSVAVILLAAVLAALTPDLPRFFLLLGVVLAGFFAWVALLTIISMHSSNHPGSGTESSRASATITAFLFFSACALFIWIWQVLNGRRAPGLTVLVISLLVMPLIMTRWRADFLTPRAHPLPPLSITTINEANALGTASEGQTLWSEFLVTGLPAHTIVVSENTGATFTPSGQTKAVRLPQFQRVVYYGAYPNNVLGRVAPMNSPQEATYLEAIHGWFPPETLWAGRRIDNWESFPNVDQTLKKYKTRPVIGGLNCHLELDEFEVSLAATLPLRAGAWTIAPGKRLVIHELTHTPTGIQLEIEEILAAPMLSRSEYLTSPAYGGNNRGYCTYVLHQPDWGTAEILDCHQFSYSQPDVLTGESRQILRYDLPYPALPEKLTGVSRQEFLAKARLCVFVPEYQGTIRQTVQETNFDLSAVHSASPGDSDDLKSVEIIGQTVLPANPTAAQRSDYLDAILGHLPDACGDSQKRKIQRQLAAIGSPGVPLLLERLPLDTPVEHDFVFPLLTKLATREQLPELRAALGKDLQLAEWFHEMKWDDDARDIVLHQLSDHRRHFSAVALRLAAAAKDPATYPDLAWHFARLDNMQDQAAEALAQCPGFDLAAAVRDAWHRERLGLNRSDDMLILAAKQGIPDAFNRAVINLEQGNYAALHRQYQALQIAGLTDFSGPPDTAQGWLSANLGRFHYDAATHRYLLPTQSNAQ